jgi:hypothetical protein
VAAQVLEHFPAKWKPAFGQKNAVKPRASRRFHARSPSARQSLLRGGAMLEQPQFPSRTMISALNQLRGMAEVILRRS